MTPATALALRDDELPLEDRALRTFLDTLEMSIRDDTRATTESLSLLDFIAQAWSIIEPKRAVRQQLAHRRDRGAPRSRHPRPARRPAHQRAAGLHEVRAGVGHVAGVGVDAAPELRYLCGSYDEQLAIRDNRRMRDIIESRWYQPAGR
jgi:hypothetical protein